MESAKSGLRGDPVARTTPSDDTRDTSLNVLPLLSAEVETLIQGQLKAFLEVHEHWEFEDDTEAVFDEWMHSRIKELRKALASLQERSRIREGQQQGKD